MLHIVLFEPLIPGNTGNLIRLSANVGAELHLIRPLVFNFDESHFRRASLDYADLTVITEHENFAAYVRSHHDRRIFAVTTKASRVYAEAKFSENDSLLFGREDTGLPDEIINGIPPDQRLLIPMRPANRSLNLSNSVALIAYEAWRQTDFQGRMP